MEAPQITFEPQAELFAPAEQVSVAPVTFTISIERRVERALKVLEGLLKEDRPLVIPFSGGKDSSTVAFLVTTAARRHAAAGGDPLIVAVSSSTGVENPEIDGYFRGELAKMRAYGQANGFRVETQVVTPTLAASMPVKILTGRALPSFQGSKGHCTVDWKISPQLRWRNTFFREMKAAGKPEPVICLGTRYEESVRRKANMLARGESDTVPMRNPDGELVLSPISLWNTDDVWELIGEAAAGTWGPSYSDFAETRRIYAHSEGTSCAVVADAIATGRQKGGCGARHGCWSCQVVSSDKSMENLLAYDARYDYMRGLYRLNRFIAATRWDWSRRNWVGRTIIDGYIKIEPDTYHPTMIRELGRYMLQLDFDEERRAAAAGQRPKFTILPLATMIAVDALQSLQGVALPFQMWADYVAIRSGKVRYDVPELEPVPQTPMPAAKYLYVGDKWDDGAPNRNWSGMRDLVVESLAGDCLPETKLLEDGRIVYDLHSESSFSVDEESAIMLMDFELDRMLEMHAEAKRSGAGETMAYRWYLQYGVLTLAHSQVSEHDAILRRTDFKHRHGLTLDYSLEALQAMAVARSSSRREVEQESMQSVLL
jgi:3'-phosphoadenosine 5'-phosphosulfate sulfotransferase (PAPS reductase)/FAD synthetase